MPEGTIFFANEPILRVTAPLPEAQLVETRLMNILHFQSLIASKAARYKLAAPNQSLIDFGFRRSHGLEAGLMAARASYIAGFTGTATVMAGKLFAIPIFGTLAHSFIQAFDDESDAFEAFARARPENLTLLIDTYDTERGAEKVVALAPRLKEAGIGIGAVRLDSGDLISLSKSVRRILDTGGLESVLIFASGGITEDQILAMAAADAPINGFGVGTDLTVSSDVPALDCAYKLQEYAGVARRKQSTGKATWPGRKQVWRNFDADGCMTGDVISLEDDDQAGEPLIKQVMKGGVRLCPLPTLDEIRDRAASGLEHLPEPLRRLELGASYPILIADRLQELAEAVDRRLTR
jgi:nicotinate phosphoribosyltransferase